jgi:nicotinamidase-related amidase
MAVTTLDPKTALIVVDLQKGAVSAKSAEAVKHSATLADAFRRRRLPVVLVNVAGGAPGRKEAAGGGGVQRAPDWTEIVPELNQQPADHTVTKKTWGAFTNTDLAEFLKAGSITQVVICGIATSIGVESTARQAHELGLNVTLAIDAMADGNAEAHANSTTRIFPRLGETGTTREIIDLLEKSPT